MGSRGTGLIISWISGGSYDGPRAAGSKDERDRRPARITVRIGSWGGSGGSSAVVFGGERDSFNLTVLMFTALVLIAVFVHWTYQRDAGRTRRRVTLR